MSSGIKTGRIKVDDQVGKKTRFSKKKTGFCSRKTLDATKLGGNQSKCAKQQIHLHVNMAETLFNCFAASKVLFSTCSKNKRHGKANVFKKAKSLKEAIMQEALGLRVVANKTKRKERS